MILFFPPPTFPSPFRSLPDPFPLPFLSHHSLSRPVLFFLSLLLSLHRPIIFTSPLIMRTSRHSPFRISIMSFLNHPFPKRCSTFILTHSFTSPSHHFPFLLFPSLSFLSLPFPSFILLSISIILLPFLPFPSLFYTSFSYGGEGEGVSVGRPSDYFS